MVQSSDQQEPDLSWWQVVRDSGAGIGLEAIGTSTGGGKTAFAGTELRDATSRRVSRTTGMVDAPVRG